MTAATRNVDLHITTALPGVKNLADEIGSAFRKEDYFMVLQHYDLLLASSDLEVIAVAATEHRSEMQLMETEELSKNVLSKEFLTWRLTTTEGCACASSGSYPLVKPADVSDTGYVLYDAEQRLELAWAQALLASMRQMPEEDEHHEEIINDFERFFNRCSEFLRAVLRPTSGASAMLESILAEAGPSSASFALEAVLLKHPAHDIDTLASLVHLMKTREIPMTVAAAEQIEKGYARLMKGPIAEKVFNTILAAGMVPLSTRPFAMLFNNLNDGPALLSAYDLMLDYGIPPETSTLRILSKQSKSDLTAPHFVARLKSLMSAGGDASSSAAAAAAAAGPLLGMKHSDPHSNSAAATDDTQSASRRRDKRIYFTQRLQELAESNPTASLLEAMKVLHRADVEGTSLQGDRGILTALLRLFCNGTTPLHLLKEPFVSSLAYGPWKIPPVNGPAAIHTPADGATTAEGADKTDFLPGGEKLQRENAFNFGFNGTEDELLEEEGQNTAHDDLLVPGEVQPLEDMAETREAPAPLTTVKSSLIADCGEEAAYVLRVLAQYDCFPDNTMLQTLAAHYEALPSGVDVIAQVVKALVQRCYELRGTLEPVNCKHCTGLMSYYVHNNQPDRAIDLIRLFVELFYAYRVTFRADLGKTDRNFLYLATMVGVHVGSPSWAVGLYTIAMAFSDRQTPSVVSEELVEKCKNDPQTAPVIEDLQRMKWNRNRMLRSNDLLLPPQERSMGGKDGGKDLTSDVAIDVELSVFGSSRPADARPGLVSFAFLALREMGVKKDVMSWIRNLLMTARTEAMARKLDKIRYDERQS